jgi:hypothetical protein
MSKASVSQVGRVAFEVDRFELVGGDSCKLQGRWFGVRGRRFMRPALTVVVDGQPTRLLADLAHKPWAAEDGEPWEAVFPCPADGGDLLEAELTVGPDVTITLPAPGGRVTTRKKKLSADGALSSRPGGRRHAGDGSNAGRRAAVDRPVERRRVEAEMERVESEKARALARIDDLVESLSEATRERDEAGAARDRLAAERQALDSEAGQIVAERDAARREHRKAVTERDAAQRARDEAIRAGQAADVARDGALADRDAAVAARDEAVAERDALARTTERLQAELTGLLSARGAAMVMRRAAQESPASRARLRAYSRPIAVAIIVLLAIVVLIALGVL